MEGKQGKAEGVPQIPLEGGSKTPPQHPSSWGLFHASSLLLVRR